jgi:hypothetical protein
MFVSVEKAMELTGRSKNVLYRQMSKGLINFARCTKGKRYLEVAELRRVYGELNVEPVEPTPIGGGNELFTLIEQMREELASLSAKVEKQNVVIESLAQGGVAVSAAAPTAAPEPAPLVADSPEKDPEWPPFITCYADLAKRDEIKARYEK